MKKDIFIDAQIANTFPKPPNKHIEELIKWLIKYDDNNLQNNAYLIINPKLLLEYTGGNQGCSSPKSILSIMTVLKSKDRLINISTKDIKKIYSKHRKQIDKIKITKIDKEFHIPTLLSEQCERKIALIGDKPFLNAILNFKGCKPPIQVVDCPSKTDYA